MLNLKLEIGSQIWVYHDSQSDPRNCIATINKYAHVCVYTGFSMMEGQYLHEVVHVSKKSSRGYLKAAIVREDITKVIKPHQQVFLGHRLESCQFAGNTRERIAARALACAEEPRIVFNYNHR